jgi:hypothetical protein
VQRSIVIRGPTKREDSDKGSNVDPDNQTKNVQAPVNDFGLPLNVPTELLQQQVHQNPELLDQQMSQDQQSELFGQKMRQEDKGDSPSR